VIRNNIFKDNRMNYLDLLPDDVMKIINRKVQELHIIERRAERKRNRKINREQKQVADRMRDIFEKFVLLYQIHLRDKYIKIVKNNWDWNYLVMIIDNLYRYGDAKHEYEYNRQLLLYGNYEII
jgi:hypothetical protein